MKKFLAVFVAIAGAGIVLYAGAALLVTYKSVFGYDPVYAGLGGLVLLAGGLLMRQD